MFGSPVSSGLSIAKVIGGLSKTLSIANQVIPLYKQVVPMVSNAKNALSVLKSLQTSEPKNKSNKANSVISHKKTEKKETSVLNNPVFFV